MKKKKPILLYPPRLGKTTSIRSYILAIINNIDIKFGFIDYEKERGNEQKRN